MSVAKWQMSCERDVIETEIPNTSVYHAIGRKCHDRAYDCSCKTIIPIVELVDCQSATNQTSAEERCVGEDKLPHCRVVVREDLEFSIEVS